MYVFAEQSINTDKLSEKVSDNRNSLETLSKMIAEKT